ncbi:MAG: GAF domain-containing protein, partial [Leptospiraceae bacterium]|nr:GAF domain-containing protein [Leptospiraceae bacterium]
RVLEMFRGITPQERERLNRRYDPIVQATRIQNAVRLYNHRDYCERRLTQEETPPGNPASETDAEYDSGSTINGGIIPGEVPRGNHGHKFMILLCSMMCEFMLGNLDAAARLARSARRHNRLSIRTTHAVDFDFYDALILMQLYHSAPNAKRMRQIKATVSRMHRLSRRFPDHFQHRAALLRAEYLSLENGPATATRSEEIMQLYDRAVDGAARGRIPLEEALANECAARFHYRHQRHKFARLLLAEAIYLYDSLGMDAVIARLRREFHSIAVADSAFMPLHARRMPDSHLSQLDMMTVLRSSRALSSEIVLGKLLARLMQILIENAGASRGCFLMERDGRLYIEAEGTVDQQDVQVLQYVPAEESERVPMTILHYVARTRKNIVLSDATRSDMFQNDPFIKANQTRSLLCTPVIHQGKLIGIVYLENNLNSGAFTPERLEVIETLSSQAAISVENARLYLDLEEKVTERTHDLNNALTEVRALKEQQDGDYFLTSLLVQPLTTGRIASETVQIDFFLRQK